MKNLLFKLFHALTRYFLLILGLIAAGIIGVVIFCITIEMQLPNVDVLNDVHMQVPLRVYTQEGELVAEYGASRRMPVTLDQVPKPLVQAILATEDQRFYSHPGVDFIGLFRAFKVLLGTGQKSQGASTITMQVARNFFLSHKKTYIRKIREILLALKIERNFSKDKILELYLNKVYFGNRAYGVAAAASVYYGKALDQLTLAEMAMIAGLPQAPSKNNPIARPAAATERRNHVLLRMLGVGDISKAQYLQAIHEQDHASYHGPSVSVNAPYVAEMVRQYMADKYGENAYDQGFSVYTTLSTQLQNAATSNLQLGLINYTERHGYYGTKTYFEKNIMDWQQVWQSKLAQLSLSSNILQPAAVLAIDTNQVQALLADGSKIIIAANQFSWAMPKNIDLKVGEQIWVRPVDNVWRLESLPKVQGALVTLDPQNGAILSLVGGYDFQLSEFNRATQAQRQPGSSFKPFIYSAALNKGYTLASTINDSPIVMNDSGEDSVWRPRNDSRQFSGITRLREGLVKSLNMVSIRLLQDIGIPYAVNFVQRFGFDPSRLPQSLSLALGAGLTSPLSMATGYSVFANGGYRVTPYFIDHITDGDQKIIFTAKPAHACPVCITDPAAAQNQTDLAPQVLDSQNAYLITQALQDVINSGTGKAATVLRRSDLAGKTGTTNDKVDAWFSGFNSKIVTTVWIGFDDLTSTHEYGGDVALSIWINFMRTALAGMPTSTMPQPPGIVTARIDPQTGLLAGINQPDAVFEVFRQGTEPHTQAPVSAGSGNIF
ncbi:MAG: penicillin-binding protein 1A [Proteobacteria bacterium]|nr:penicillin-binding protein 1A [Pseudomonadota bacterium]